MDRLVDYVKWMRDFPIACTGFRDADALVLCALSYYDLSPVFAQSDAPTVADCRSLIESGNAKVMVTGGDEGFPELLECVAASKRFGELRMTGYTDLFRQDPPLQFSAVCFHDPTDLSFMAFRGTDSSLSGWKEDFMISFTLTESQELALQYAREHLSPDRRWYMCGHSKGANLALYAACRMDEAAWDRVERLFLLDGPGFCPQVLDISLQERVDPKATQINPAYCVIGKLFAPRIGDTRIVRSSAGGILQHGCITWGIDHGDLAPAEGYEPESVILSEAIDLWIEGISQEDREILVDEIFQTLAAGGSETFDGIVTGGWSKIESILRQFGEISASTKQALTELPKYTRKVGFEALKKRLAAEWEQRKKALEQSPLFSPGGLLSDRTEKKEDSAGE